MKLNCRINPQYFGMLGYSKFIEYRQIEEIKFTNTVTGEIRIFNVRDIAKADYFTTQKVKSMYPDVPWDDRYPIFAFHLGDEIKPTSTEEALDLWIPECLVEHLDTVPEPHSRGH